MDAYIEEKSVDLGGGIAMKVYQVEYCAIQGMAMTLEAYGVPSAYMNVMRSRSL